MNKLRNRLIIIAAIVSLVIIGILAFKYIAPFGKIISYSFSKRLSGLEPISKTTGKQNDSIRLSSQIIITNISRFNLNIDPKNIENIKIALKFKPGPREIKIGVRNNEKDPFFYQPLYFSLLKNFDWPNIQESGLTLWQRRKSFSSIESFIKKPPEEGKIGSYMLNQNKILDIASSGGVVGETTINSPLRGNHLLFILVNQKPLVIKVTKQDMNAYDGADKLNLSLFKQQKLLLQKTINDDGIIDKSRLRALPQEAEIKIDEAQPGIYQLNFSFDSAGSDSLINEIKINQKAVVIQKNLFFLGENPTTFFTNSQKITVLTPHDNYIQTLLLNKEKKLEIAESVKEFNFDLEKLAGKLEKEDLYQLESPKNDLIISGDGYFSFSKGSFFYPEIIKTIDIANFDNQLQVYDGIDYILTSLPPIKRDGDWLISEVNIDPKDIGIDSDTLYFSLEIPDLDKYGGSLEIESFEVTIKDKGMLEKRELISPTPSTSPENKDGSKKMGLVEKIGKFEVGIFDKIKEFFTNTIKKIKLPFISKTGPPTPTPTPTTTPKPMPTSAKVTTPTPTSKITPTPPLKPTATPTTVKQAINILVKVLNGGAEKGIAGKFADDLKAAGFTNVSAGNADKTTYSNATVQYRNSDKSIVDKIVDLLKNDYKTIERKEISTASAEIIVILGNK